MKTVLIGADNQAIAITIRDGNPGYMVVTWEHGGAQQTLGIPYDNITVPSGTVYRWYTCGMFQRTEELDLWATEYALREG
jgi:hypothetical protein